jgi:oligopeptide transport system ATP-binding protein
MVFQDPFGSLSPRPHRGRDRRPKGSWSTSRRCPAASATGALGEAFSEVRLEPAWRNRFPHEFSGGQRQRVAIARAMILHPKLVVLDEPTSALDRSVQKEIVELLRDLQRRHALAFVFISHDLAVVRALSDAILVMRNGRVVESGPVEAIFERPAEPYTRELMAAALLGRPGAPAAALASGEGVAPA